MLPEFPKHPTIEDAKRFLTQLFRDAHIESSDMDARLLLMDAMGLARTDLITQSKEPIADEALDKVKGLAKRRLSGEPIDHILGYREFYGRQFKVSKAVLSPRPETEMLVDEALSLIKQNKSTQRILDLGTGSGAILISILAAAKHVSGTGVDISKAALNIARNNAKSQKVDNRAQFLIGDWFQPVLGRYDIIISNPPYITEKAMEALDYEVKLYDPFLALSGGEDGLNAYKNIIFSAKDYLKDDGTLLFEIGYDQGVSVSHLLKEAGFSNVRIEKDLAGHDRLICC